VTEDTNAATIRYVFDTIWQDEGDYRDACAEALESLDALVAERDALREALTEIVGHPVVSEGEFPDDNCDWHCVAEIQDLARRALSEPEAGAKSVPSGATSGSLNDLENHG
jgi:hypothetical protein